MSAFHLAFLILMIPTPAPENGLEKASLVSKSQIFADGTIEYSFKISATIEKTAVLSVLEFDRTNGKDSLTDARQSIWYSKDRRDEKSKIIFSVKPTTDKNGRTVQFKGASLSTSRRPIPNSATISVSNRQVLVGKSENHVIDIVITNNFREMERYTVVARVSALADHPRMAERIKEIQNEAKALPLNAITFVDKVDNPADSIHAFITDSIK